MIDWIPKKHLLTFSELPARERRRIWWDLYFKTFKNPRALATLLLLLGVLLAGVWSMSLLSGLLVLVCFWLHWAVCGRIAYPKVEGALRADGLLFDQSSDND